ncbi:hypothetical protein AWC19_25680 [Mycobacterium palustre]|uniref:Uncharacterized protein n=1 Tax=Mycobacterium palustre TaxID=153971 RepID=A0A1X1ZXK0_9MYCO|nr:hypothetical protein AWC19_25680 [Mycobacterium palustre]
MGSAEVLGRPPIDVRKQNPQLCVSADPVCSDAMKFSAQDARASEDGLVDVGEDFAADHLRHCGPSGFASPVRPVRGCLRRAPRHMAT